MTFKDTLRDVYDACGPIFYRRPSNEDILQAATQIYIAQMKEDTMATIDKLELKIGIKNYRSTMRTVKKVTKALEKLNKASNECSEAFKELKENIPMIFELEGKE